MSIFARSASTSLLGVGDARCRELALAGSDAMLDYGRETQMKLLGASFLKMPVRGDGLDGQSLHLGSLFGSGVRRG